jgi:N-formylglutamate deformylase
MEIFHFRQGRSPLLVSMPHVGTHIPESIGARMTRRALELPDTDWHLERLYDFLDGLGASLLAATHSRYVIDLNRPPDGANLYPGQDTTALCPLDTFAKDPVYRSGEEPADAEIAERVETYWRPYHAKLAGELANLKRRHGFALLWEAHAIFSQVPRFFSGRLPDFNLGTADGASCGPGIGEALLKVAQRAAGFSAVLNGRFKGGYITRHYGRPNEGMHAVQLELASITYMDERPPYAFDEERAARVRPHLRAMLEKFLERVFLVPD